MKVLKVNMREPGFEKQLISSIITSGFAVLTNHGIPHDLITNIQDSWRSFFLKSGATKEFFIDTSGKDLGYHGFKSEKAVGAKKADLKQFIHMRPGPGVFHNTEAGNLASSLFYKLNDLGLVVLHILDKHYQEVTGQNLHFKDSCEDSENTILRVLHYPKLDFPMEIGEVRAAQHEDINHITLLPVATAPGLEVLDNHWNWIPAPFEPESIVINVGDMLQMLTKGLYKSTTHRVVNPDNSTSDRISMPLFIHPKPDTVLAEGITAQQYLNERIGLIYGKAKL